MSTNNELQANRLNKSDLRKSFALYVSQSVLAMIGFSAYILADTYFVATGIGPMALAGLNIALPVYSIILGTGMLMSVGGSTLFAVTKARGDKNLANKIFTFAVVAAVIVGFVFFIGGRLFAIDLAYLFGGDNETVPYAGTYIRVVSTFAVPFMLNNIVVAFIRNDNAPKFATASLLAGNFTNLILDWIFIYPLKMGMFGAALATGTAPIVGLLVLSTYFLKGKSSFRFGNLREMVITDENREISPLRNAFWISRGVLVLGLSNFIIEISSGLSMIAFNIAFWTISGNLGVSAYSIVANIGFVVNALFNGIGQGMQPLISNCHGRGKTADLRYVIKLGLITSICMASVSYVILYAFATPFADIFNKNVDPELNMMASLGIRCYFVAFFFSGLNIVIAASLNAQEAAVKSLLITVGRGLILLVPSIILLARLKSIEALWFALPLAEVITLAIITVTFLVKTKQYDQTTK
ncbi:MAG: MATE family efflux transporter [Clostridiales bacterium]|nr:MATE family efflux transporter [Clostridiales bacterium]MDD7346929.1 MATE family efflux transporter [Clostridiales bacterium]MDY4061191.1 MATE family efflux transporter [Anaerovoracaceae bacterium]